MLYVYNISSNIVHHKNVEFVDLTYLKKHVIFNEEQDFFPAQIVNKHLPT